MIKYRRLSLEELAQLEQEFIRFLAAQSIVADDWVKIKKTDKTRADELLDEFSNVVIEKTLFNAKYVEQRTKKRILCYKIESNKILLNGLELESEVNFDFLTEFQLSDLVSLFENPEIKISFLSGSKSTDNIKQEVYSLLDEGGMISESASLYEFIITLKNHFSDEEE